MNMETMGAKVKEIIEPVIKGLGVALEDMELRKMGRRVFLRVIIDKEGGVTISDCTSVSRDFARILEIEDIIEHPYTLEVSSPGIDRPLRHEQDFVRFAGEVIDITLKAPLGAAAEGQVNANRKKFRGTLERAETGGWQIVWSEERPVKPGQKVSKKRVPAPLQALGFVLDEIRDARLAPLVDFKGRGAKAGQAEA